MIVVIQCAASKRSDAGHLVSARGKPVDFVADPLAAPVDPTRISAKPDDLSDGGISWRRMLLKYNQQDKANPLGLYPAYHLYENKIYRRLVDHIGLHKVYILSAGWGLISANFLTPHYDITFSQSAEGYKRRRKTDHYIDFRMLPDETDEEILFFGGKDYLPLFCSLTNAIKTTKTVFYNSAQRPQVSGCTLQRFETTTRTNWQYECANAFLDGAICA
jgi:hypothetical protein